jgi:hypothetical protein
MATANTPLEFTGEECATVKNLALAMKGVAAVLLLLAVVTIVVGVAMLFGRSALGLVHVIEGLVTGLLGLIMIASSANVRYMCETKFVSIHLGHALKNLTVYYKTQFGLALFLIVIGILRLI